MRIRKQASKLLGWGHHSQYPPSYSPPPPPEAASGELHCQLNISPWDAINVLQEELDIMNDSPEIGLAGNYYKTSEKEEEEIKEETESTAVMKCKKTDGKRWRCKRAAKLPHSLCSYHLTQLRSYRTRFEDQAAGDRRKKSPLPADCGGTASNYYYYYSILGPWWGKRRGPIDGGEGGSNGNCDDSLEPSSESSDDDANVETGHEGVSVVDEEDDGGRECEEKYVKKRKKRVVKKRGRKPVKSRSLKSLL